MKNLRKFSFLLIIPVIIGISLIVAGTTTDNRTMVTAGQFILFLGMPLSMFLGVVVGLILIMRENSVKRKNKPYEDTAAGENRSRNGETCLGTNERAEELEEIDEINSSYGYESHVKSYEYHERHKEKNFRYSNAKERIFAGLLFGFLIADFALIILFAFLHIIVGVIVCVVLFVAPLIIFIITVKIRERLSYRGGKVNADSLNVFCRGIVKFCVMSSSLSIDDGDKCSTTRIKDVNYRISIDYDGKEFVAYTRKFYNEGETVNFVVVKDNLVSIVN